MGLLLSHAAFAAHLGPKWYKGPYMVLALIITSADRAQGYKKLRKYLPNASLLDYRHGHG
jgi:hypothetical protein